MKDYNKALSLDSSLAGVHYNRGALYYQQYKSDLALDDFINAIELNPREAKAYCGIGQIFSNKRNFPLAISYLEKGLRLDPTISFCKEVLDQARLGIPAP